MERKSKNKKHMSVMSLVMVIFIGVFGFGNIANNFKAGGTQSTGMFILGALLAFLPLCLIISEFAAYAKDRTGGIYSWIEIGLGKEVAYFGLWSYFVANIFYLPTLASRVPTYLTFTFIGDANISNGMMAILSAITLIVALLIGTKFESKFLKLSNLTGYISLFVAIIFMIGGLGIHLGLFGTPATDLKLSEMMFSVNSIDSLSKVLSTFAWIVFAFGGAELIGTYVDKVEKPERDFVRGVLGSAILIGIFYILGILAISAFGSPEAFGKISLVNAVIGGYKFMGDAFGYGVWFVKCIGFAYTLITLVALVIWSVALSKTVFSEAPEGTFPVWLTKKNDNGVLVNALIFQTALSFVFILITNFGGDGAGELYYKIYDMSTMAFIVPYIFLGLAYINFRKLGLQSSFQYTKSKIIPYIVGGLVVFLNIGAVIFAGYDISKPFAAQIETIKLYYGGLAIFLALGAVIKLINFNGADKSKKNKIILD